MMRNREAGQNRDQQDLQEIAFGERTDERLGDDRQQVADHTLFLGAANKAGDGIGIERRRVDIESPARLQNFPDDEPNGERQRRYGFEIDEGLDADPADLLEVAHRADAVHDRAEDDRPDHHLDEGDEAVAERLERNARVRKVVPDQDADGDGDQNLDVENGVPGASTRGRCRVRFHRSGLSRIHRRKEGA